MLARRVEKPLTTQCYCRKDQQEYWQYWKGDHWTVEEQILPPRRADARSRHQLTCILMRKG
jgi:hypothetical protein